MNRTDRPYELCVERGSWTVHGSRAWKISLLAAAGRVSARGGSVRAHCGLVVVLVAAAISRAARTPASLGAREGDRDSVRADRHLTSTPSRRRCSIWEDGGVVEARFSADRESLARWTQQWRGRVAA